MKGIITLFLCCLMYSAQAQAVPPPYNGQPDIRMDTGKQQIYVPPPYWTIWFTTISCEDGYDYQSANKWVQSYNDSATAYGYYQKLRRTGKVLVWNKMKCIVDTSDVWIDKYSVVQHQYLKIKQP